MNSKEEFSPFGRSRAGHFVGGRVYWGLWRSSFGQEKGQPSKNHQSASEVWCKGFIEGLGTPSMNASQAIDVALRWGWIDGIRKNLNEPAFLQHLHVAQGQQPLVANRRRARSAALDGRTPDVARTSTRRRREGRWSLGSSPGPWSFRPSFWPPRIERGAQAIFETLGRQDQHLIDVTSTGHNDNSCRRLN